MSIAIPSHVSASAMSISAAATSIRNACTGFSTTSAIKRAEEDARRVRNEARRLIRRLSSLSAESEARDHEDASRAASAAQIIGERMEARAA